MGIINMHPSQEVFEALGFNLQSTGRITPPFGWKFKRCKDEQSKTFIIDNKGRVRGNITKDPKGNCVYMILYRRYRIIARRTNPLNNNLTVMVIDAADGTVLFNTGQYQNKYSRDYQTAMRIARKRLNHDYPGMGGSNKLLGLIIIL